MFVESCLFAPVLIDTFYRFWVCFPCPHFNYFKVVSDCCIARVEDMRIWETRLFDQFYWVGCNVSQLNSISFLLCTEFTVVNSSLSQFSSSHFSFKTHTKTTTFKIHEQLSHSYSTTTKHSCISIPFYTFTHCGKNLNHNTRASLCAATSISKKKWKPF